MDNDIKIEKMIEQRHKEVLMFLQAELEPLRQKDSTETYNLEKEYAKTKKNKSPFVILVLLGCLGAVALVSFGLSKSIEKTNKEIKVDLAEFDDVNLKNLIDTVARTQDKYEEAVRNKIQLEAEQKTELSAALSKRDNDILVVTSMNLSNKKEEQRQIAEINKEYDANVKEIEAKYEASLAMAVAEVEEYRKKLDEYDQTKLAVAQEQERALDSQRQLQEIERKKLVDTYEERIKNLETSLANTRRANDEAMKVSLKTVSEKYQNEIDSLDPIINDERANEIVSNAKNSYVYEDDFEYHDLYVDNIIDDEYLIEDLEYIKSLYDDFKYLDQMIIDIPHKHTIGEYVKATNQLVDDISVTFADVAYSLCEDIVDLEDENESLNNRIVDLNGRIVNLNGQITNLNGQITNLKKDLDDYKDQLAEAQKVNSLDATSDNDNFFIGVLTNLNATAMVRSAETKETIYIYVHPDYREQITGEGINAEIKLKKALKGRVGRLPNGNFLFIPNKDKNGNEVPFELSELFGAPVKLLSK